MELNKRMLEIHNKVDGATNNINAKVENISTHMKAFENQVAQVTSSSKSTWGTLPGKPESTRKLHLILRASILATANASINFSNKRVILFNVNANVYYSITPTTTTLCGAITHTKEAVYKEDSMGVKVENELPQVENNPTSLEDHKDGEGIFDGRCLNLLFEEPKR